MTAGTATTGSQAGEPCVILCMKWGTLYGPDYVNVLYAAVADNITVPFRFVCLTDANLPTTFHLDDIGLKICVADEQAAGEIRQKPTRDPDVVLDQAGLYASQPVFNQAFIYADQTGWVRSNWVLNSGLDVALPLIISVDPPAKHGLAFSNVTEIELHTHLLPFQNCGMQNVATCPSGCAKQGDFHCALPLV